MKIPAFPRSKAMAWSAILLAVVVFILDLITLHGRAEPVLYVVVVVLFLRSTYWRYVLVVAAACSLLTIVGSVFASAVVPMHVNVANYLFSLMAIWLTAIMGLQVNRLSDKLAASEARMRTIVETAAEGIITIDQQGTVETFNEAAAEMFGYDAAEVIGRNVKMLIPPDNRGTHERGLVNYIENGDHHVIGTTREIMGLRSDGTTFPLLIAVSEMQSNGQHVFAGIVLDMTELRLAQDRAVQAGRLAAIGEAMAGLAHESRNALQRSQAALEMLSRASADRPDALELIDRAQLAQDDLHQLYEEVRGYAAPLVLRTKACRVDAVVQEAWEVLAASREGRDARLDQTGTQFDLNCELDKSAMRRVFRNILDNSLDAIEGPVRIIANYKEVHLGGRPAIEVSVHDNGPGLDEQARRKLFEPFFTTKTSGTGLGMAIAKRCVEAHGGVIEAPADSGRGAEFRITLPKAQS